MNPELETFLENTLEAVPPTSAAIGRVVIEPDYDVEPREQDAGHLASEFAQCLREQSPDPAALVSHEGVEIEIPGAYRLLTKYIRSIRLHGDRVEGPWVEVVPPGNWI